MELALVVLRIIFQTRTLLRVRSKHPIRLPLLEKLESPTVYRSATNEPGKNLGREALQRIRPGNSIVEKRIDVHPECVCVCVSNVYRPRCLPTSKKKQNTLLTPLLPYCHKARAGERAPLHMPKKMKRRSDFFSPPTA